MGIASLLLGVIGIIAILSYGPSANGLFLWVGFICVPLAVILGLVSLIRKKMRKIIKIPLIILVVSLIIGAYLFYVLFAKIAPVHWDLVDCDHNMYAIHMAVEKWQKDHFYSELPSGATELVDGEYLKSRYSKCPSGREYIIMPSSEWGTEWPVVICTFHGTSADIEKAEKWLYKESPGKGTLGEYWAYFKGSYSKYLKECENRKQKYIQEEEIKSKGK